MCFLRYFASKPPVIDWMNPSLIESVMGEDTYILKGNIMSPSSITTRPLAEPSSGQVDTKPLGQWSQWPGSSQ